MVEQRQTKTFTQGVLPHNSYAYLNSAFFNPADYATFPGASRGDAVIVEINQIMIRAEKLDSIQKGSIGLSKFQREAMEIGKEDVVKVNPASIQDQNPLNSIEIEIDVLFANEKLPRDSKGAYQIQEEDLFSAISTLFNGKLINRSEIFPLAINEENVVLQCEVHKIENIKNEYRHLKYGMLTEKTDFICKIIQKKQALFKILSSKIQEKQIFKKNFNFQELGIGGLDREFQEIFRRAFNSRRYPSNVIEKYGIKHVRGMLLQGPPGTGKTLIARQIAKALDCTEPKVVNGPEIFSKFQGESEKNIRELFAAAEKEQKQLGDESNLHIIIFDEIDAICRQRGSTGSSGTGVHETVVNQLLSKMDGVDSLNNILVIGMTNRKDMIDEAMLRPGRLEIHLEISLPDEVGRRQIFDIHTRHMQKNELIDKDVNFDTLAAMTKNYTGAEIEAVCRGATSFALFKDLDLTTLGTIANKATDPKDKKAKTVPGKPSTGPNLSEKKVGMADFLKALEENRPAFGVDNDNLENCIRGGIYHYGESFNELYKVGQNFISVIKNQVASGSENNKSTALLSILLEGKNGCGKTALAAKLALESQFPYVKLISPENFVGYSEQGKISQIVKIFEDAYKSPMSLVILDDLERLIEFIHIGPRFSNPILQALLVLIKKKPPHPDRKLMVIGTTSMKNILQEMELVDCFNVCQHVPTVRLRQEITAVLSQFKGSTEEIRKISQELTVSRGSDDDEEVSSGFGIPIKNLLLSTELALESNPSHSLDFKTFMEAYRSVSRD